MQQYHILVQKEDDLYVVTNIELGVTTQGETIQEAIHNIKEATELYLE